MASTDAESPPPAWMQAAQREGILPAGAEAEAVEPAGRPWPVVLLTAVGAWLAALPFMGVAALLLDDVVPEAVAPYLGAAVLLVGAWSVLRRREAAVFVEQLAIPALLSGAGLLGYGFMRDLPTGLAAALLCLVAVLAARAMPRPWLRGLLGASAAPLCMVALWPDDGWVGRIHEAPLWLVPHGVLALWCLQDALAPRWLGTPRAARTVLTLQQFGQGWLLSTLAVLAVLSGPTLLLGGTMGSGLVAALLRDLGGGTDYRSAAAGWREAASALLAMGGAAVLARAWPRVRQGPAAGVAAVLVLLSCALPHLGGVLLAAALLLRHGQWRMACAAAVAAAWIVGSFYYQMATPLALKACWLVLAGASLAGMAWWAARRAPDAGFATLGPPTSASAPRSLAATWLLLASAAATLLVAQVAIREKERLISEGEPLYVALAPVDPRSLLQGDYMQLRFTLPEGLPGTTEAFRAGARPRIVLRRDARGVATPVRVQRQDEVLATDERRMELSPKNGSWVLVSDAWYFREGEAARFEQARYGEFRVTPDGRALLVGMADAALQRIDP